MDSLNEGIHLFYQLNTFYFTFPTDLIQFFTDTNSTAVDQIRSYELRCVVENTYDKPILDLDVLTGVLDRYLRPDDVKVKLEIVSEWACRPFSKACKEKAVEALGRFLALRKLGVAVVVVPHIFKEVMQKTLETLGPHISFELREAERLRPLPFTELEEFIYYFRPVARQVLLHCTSSPPSAHQSYHEWSSASSTAFRLELRESWPRHHLQPGISHPASPSTDQILGCNQLSAM